MKIPLEYSFRGYERLDLWLNNPNRCAAILCLFIPALVCMARRSFSSDAGGSVKCSKTGGGLAAIAAVIFIIALFSTYSRAGYVALSCGLAYLFFIGRIGRNMVLWAASISIVASLLIPGSLIRIYSIANISGDQSISNRWKLWIESLQLISDYPLRGCGVQAFHAIHATWYQSQSMDLVYRSSVSDLLSICAFWGVPVFFVYSSVILSLVFALNSAYKTTGNFIFLGMAAGVASYIIASLFSTFILYGDTCILFAGYVFISIGLLYFSKDSLQKSMVSKSLRQGSVCAAVLAVVIIISAACAKAQMLYNVTNAGEIADTIELVELHPSRKTELKGDVVVLMTKWSLPREAKNIFRPLAESGRHVIALRIGDLSIKSPITISNLVRSKGVALGKACHIISYGDASAIAVSREFIESTHPATITMIEPMQRHPENTLSTINNFIRVSVPTLLIGLPTKAMQSDASPERMHEIGKSHGLDIAFARAPLGSVSSVLRESVRLSLTFIDSKECSR